MSRGALWLVAGAVAAACVQPPHLVHLDEGEANLAVGDADAAVAAYRVALDVTPDQPDALLGLARAELARADGDAALAALDRLVEIDAGAAVAGRTTELRCAALVAVATRRLERDESAAGPAGELELVPCAGAAARDARVAVHLDEAGRDRRAGRPEQALAHYAAAREADPDRVAGFSEAAELLLDAGRRDEAIGLLSAGLERHPREARLRELMVAALGVR